MTMPLRRIKPAIRLDFMTDDVNEAEGMQCEVDVGKCVGWKAELGQCNGV